MEAAKSIGLPFSSNSFSLKENETENYFKVEVGQNYRLSVSISFDHHVGDLDLYLLSSDGTRIAYSNGVTNSETFNKELQAGHYYILVVGYKNAVGSYSLSVE